MRKQANAAAAKSLQSCPTLCDPIDSSPPGSPNHGIFQAGVLEWVAVAFSKQMLHMMLKKHSQRENLDKIKVNSRKWIVQNIEKTGT